MNEQNKEKTNEVKNEKPQVEQQAQRMRKIIIEFDANSVNVPTAEVSSNFELLAVLQTIINKITVQK